jgi:hypothetical protein
MNDGLQDKELLWLLAVYTGQADTCDPVQLHMSSGLHNLPEYGLH